MIHRRSNHKEIEDYAHLQQGMKSLREDGVAKVLAGITTLEELNRVTPKEAKFV